MERRASRIGQEYRLIPVALPAGVFHPKCTYLHGPEGDVLLVGSGNLTFGGYGKNLEVIEVLRSQVAPLAFLDFATFLEGLAARPDLLAAERDWASGFAEFARRAAGPVGESRSDAQPRLISSVEAPILDQLVERVTAQGNARDVTVLSPFHDTDGSSVLKLAKRTGAHVVRVGVPPSGEPSEFPFTASQRWGLDVRAVRPKADGPKRPLHAKWIDVNLGDRCLTLTGSVNATAPALCRTDNVEVGVIRTRPVPSEDQWEPISIPSVVATRTRVPGGLGIGCVVSASVRSDGTLSGRILSLGDPSGRWEGQIERANGDGWPIVIDTDREGRFRVAMRMGLFVPASLQIELRCEERVARGWVHVEEILRLPRLQGLERSALMRLIGREDTAEDDAALLDYLADSARRHLTTFERPIATPAGDRGEQERTTTDGRIDLGSLAPLAETPTIGTPRWDSWGSSDPLDRLFGHLRRTLLASRGAGGTETRRDEDERWVEQAETEDPDQELAGAERLAGRLEEFDRRMRDITADPQATLPDRRTLAVIWLEVALYMRLRRLGDRSEAEAFVRDWSDYVCAELAGAAETGSLWQHLVTIAALRFGTAEGDEAQAQLGPRLHGQLEHFLGGPVDHTSAQNGLLDREGVGVGALLLGEQRLDLHRALRDLLDTKSLRIVILEVLDTLRRGETVPEDSPAFGCESGRSLRSMLRRPRIAQAFREQRDPRAICAWCYVLLTPMGANDLKYCRIAHCKMCNRFTIRTSP